jgi:hypothetical protein
VNASVHDKFWFTTLIISSDVGLSCLSYPFFWDFVRITFSTTLATVTGADHSVLASLEIENSASVIHFCCAGFVPQVHQQTHTRHHKNLKQTV